MAEAGEGGAGAACVFGAGGDWTDFFWLVRLRVAAFPAGGAAALVAMEPALRARGVEVAMVLEPTGADLSLLSPSSGALYGPALVSWEQPVRSFAAWLDTRALPPAQRRKKLADYQRRLDAFDRPFADGSRLTLRVDPIAPGPYAEWRALYLRSVVARDNGVDVAWPDLPPAAAASGDFELMSVRDDARGDLAGGMVLETVPGEGLLRIRYAAFETGEPHRQRSLSWRCFAEAMALAARRGHRVLSYGSDPNLFGGDPRNLGLHRFKQSLGFEPTLHRRPGEPTETRLLRIFDPRPFHGFLLAYVFREEDRVHDGRGRLAVATLGDPPPDFAIPDAARFPRRVLRRP